MLLGMAVRAKQLTLASLCHDSIPFPIRKYPHIQLKAFPSRVGMMEVQRCSICLITTFLTPSTELLNQLKLALQ
jgi:hypothetical protein